jgi:hypothetical protein
MVESGSTEQLYPVHTRPRVFVINFIIGNGSIKPMRNLIWLGSERAIDIYDLSSPNSV